MKVFNNVLYGAGNRWAISLHLTGLNYIYLHKHNSDKFWFLFQWNMPSLEHFIINQK